MLEKLTPFDEVYVFRPKRFGDHRGFFSETYQQPRLKEMGFDVNFVQDNVSFSKDKGTLRGVHFQAEPFAQGKFVSVLRGAILDVMVDIRHGSPTFGQWASIELSDENWTQVYVPVGFAHGFCTLVDDTLVHYKVTNVYSGAHDVGIAFDDPDLAIDWPVEHDKAILSEKDSKHPQLKDLQAYFHYQGASVY